MSGHSRWLTVRDRGELAKALGGDVAVENLVQFVQGYILALDDLILDIDNMRYDTESMEGEYPDGYHGALEAITSNIQHIKELAHGTLNQLRKKKDEG